MTYYSLFAVTIFLSSFLLFQVQPLIGKHILPWYGGSSAVWMSALFFFMVALAVGYVYALLLSRLRLKLQLAIHASLLFLVMCQMYIHTQLWPSGITPNTLESFGITGDPVWSVFITLATTIGLPFVLLSATSSLIQLWYNQLSGREPFSLYSISNVGSLLGLLSYPVFFEPLLATPTQGQWWTNGLALYLGLMWAIVFLLYREVSGEAKDKNPLHINTFFGRAFWRWVGAASVPVMVLLSGTTFMTSAVAPIPLLWVGPLALYLLSFIWTFRMGRSLYLPSFNQGALVVLGLVALVLASSGAAPVFATIFVIHATSLAIFHWCHEYLHATKPAASDLPVFYVALSLGGILGSIVIKISSLYFLTLPIELNLIMLGCLFFIMYQWYQGAPSFLPPHLKTNIKTYSTAYAVLVIFISVYYIYDFSEHTTSTARNFFGYKAVIEYVNNGQLVRSLQHGLTNHGFQVLEDGELKVLPVSYYSPSGGVGKAFTYLQEKVGAESLSVAVVGLGTGGLAAYCRPQDSYHFIEIDPQVIALAKENFTYLEYCPQYSLTIGDGRLALTAEVEAGQREAYDMIILDAYADDMMPVHLMTKEAIALYTKLLKPDGFLAINISSRYLNLLPVTIYLAKENNLAFRSWFDRVPEAPHASLSQWVLLSQDDTLFETSQFAGMQTLPVDAEVVRWSDTYSALLPTIKFW